MNGKIKSVAILNSRQNLRPVGSDVWIQNTIEAVQSLSGQDIVLLTSVGMKTWELLVYLAVKYKIKQCIYIPITADKKNIDVIAHYAKQFGLSQELTDYYSFEIDNLKKDNAFYQKERDKLICDSADIIYPVSIRPGSTLRSLYDNDDAPQVVVDRQYTAQYQKSKISYKYEIDKSKINPKIDHRLDRFIIHWTRAANNKWPGENLYAYYESIVGSKNMYAHSAYDTLIRILSEQKLRTSSRHFRKDFSAVSFSDLKPSDAIDLMKWRARYSEMSFEPYGLALRKTTAEKIGVRKVIYNASNKYDKLNAEDKPYFQSLGTKGYWQPEKEWRFIGTLDLTKINIEDIKIIVQHRNEIDSIKEFTNSEIISLYK